MSIRDEKIGGGMMPRRVRLKGEGTERQIILRRIAIGPIVLDEDREEFISRMGKLGLER